mmetsp:Transcript_126602/g.270050  ORF Transcript_126602/g.270050 Transcript_126602/m.270050 type:complete len:225 (-) Transcript_126602:295-969(-)
MCNMLGAVGSKTAVAWTMKDESLSGAAALVSVGCCATKAGASATTGAAAGAGEAGAVTTGAACGGLDLGAMPAGLCGSVGAAAGGAAGKDGAEAGAAPASGRKSKTGACGDSPDFGGCSATGLVVLPGACPAVELTSCGVGVVGAFGAGTITGAGVTGGLTPPPPPPGERCSGTAAVGAAVGAGGVRGGVAAAAAACATAAATPTPSDLSEGVSPSPASSFRTG